MPSVFKRASVAHATHQPSSDRDALESVLSREAFATARDAICAWPAYAATPLYALPALAASCGVAELLYKDEGPRFSLGSFKALGGAYAAQQLLQRELSARLGRAVGLADISAGHYKEQARDIHIVTATDGNHGRSVAWGCQLFGASCHIYIHAEVSAGRADAMASLGATITRVDGNYDASVRAAKQAAEDKGWFVVSDTSYADYTQVPTQVMAGYGVLAQEVVDELGDNPPSHVLLQGGVGGLAAAVAALFYQAWGDRMPRVVIVEPVLADCLYQSALAGQIIAVDIQDETLMAGLSCGEPSVLAWRVLAATATDFVTLPEQLVAPSMQRLQAPLLSDPSIEAGESAVAGVACVLAAASQPALYASLGLDSESRVLLIGSEGATDREIYERLIAEPVV